MSQDFYDFVESAASADTTTVNEKSAAQARRLGRRRNASAFS